MDDDICRACSVQRRSLRPLFHKVGSHTYADLLTIIANVKIHQNDEGPKKICLICRSKAEEAFAFKVLVERSNKNFYNDSGNTRRIIFDNINEIKTEINYDNMDNLISTDDVKDIIIKFGNENEIAYHDTIIKRYIKLKTEPNIKVEELIHNFKSEIPADIMNDDAIENDYYDDDCMDNKDDEYLPPGANFNKKAFSEENHLKKKKKEKDVIKNIREVQNNNDNQKSNKRKYTRPLFEKLSKKDKIIPVYMNDVHVVTSRAKTESTKPKTNITRKKNLNQNRLCPHCGKITDKLSSHLKVHEKKGEKKFKCNKCPKMFFTKKELTIHEVVHTGVRAYKCDTCGTAFYTREILARHVTLHLNIRNHECKLCFKRFRLKSTLQGHILRHSSANKNVKCEQCSMSFFDKSQLQAHMRVHTGERPWKCEICSQPYSYKRDFDRHCLKKHGMYVQKRRLRLMTEEVLQKERILVRAALERQQNASAVQSILPTSDGSTEEQSMNVNQLIVDPSQLKILFKVN